MNKNITLNILGSFINKLKTLNNICDNLSEKKDNTDDANLKSKIDTDFFILIENINGTKYLILAQKISFTKENIENYRTLENIHSSRDEGESGEYNCAALISDLSLSSSYYIENNGEKYKQILDNIGPSIKHNRIPSESILITKVKEYNGLYNQPFFLNIDWYSIMTNQTNINDYSFEPGMYVCGKNFNLTEHLYKKYSDYKTFFCYPISDNQKDQEKFRGEIINGIIDLKFRMWNSSVRIKTNLISTEGNIEYLDYPKLDGFDQENDDYNLPKLNNNSKDRPWVDLKNKKYNLKYYKYNEYIIIDIDDEFFISYKIDETNNEVYRKEGNGHKTKCKNILNLPFEENDYRCNNYFIFKQIVIMRSNASNDYFNKMMTPWCSDNNKRCINMRGNRVIGKQFNWSSKDKRNIWNNNTNEASRSFMITIWSGKCDKEIGIHVNYNKSASDPNTCKEYFKQIFVDIIDQISQKHVTDYSVKSIADEADEADEDEEAGHGKEEVSKQEVEVEKEEVEKEEVEKQEEEEVKKPPAKRKPFPKRIIDKKLQENPYDPLLGVDLSKFGWGGIYFRHIDHKNKNALDISEENCQPLSIITHAIKTSDEQNGPKCDLFNKLKENEEDRMKFQLFLIKELIKGSKKSCPNNIDNINHCISNI